MVDSNDNEDSSEHESTDSDKISHASAKPAKVALYLIPLLVVAAIAIFVFLPMNSNSPVEVVKLAGKAALDRDLATFEKYVDLESVLTRAVPDLMAASMSKMSPEEAEHMEMDAFGAEEMGFIDPAIAKVMARLVEEVVETGQMDLLSLMPADMEEFMDPTEPVDVFDNLDRQVEVVKIEETARKGKTATVTVSLIEKETDEVIELDLLLRNTGGDWQIAEVSNLKDIDTEFLGEDLSLDDIEGFGGFPADEMEMAAMEGELQHMQRESLVPQPCSDAEDGTSDSSEGEWTEVYSASGDNDIVTEEFTITNSPFRVTWESKPDPDSDMYKPGFSAHIFCSGVDPMNVPPSTTVVEGLSGTDSKGSREIYDSGTMFMDIMSFGDPWKLTVEERR